MEELPDGHKIQRQVHESPTGLPAARLVIPQPHPTALLPHPRGLPALPTALHLLPAQGLSAPLTLCSFAVKSIILLKDISELARIPPELELLAVTL